MQHRPLSEVCLVITDGSHFSPSTIGSGLPYVTVRDLRDGLIDTKSCAKISTEDFDKLSKNGCQPILGDVLFSKDGTVGKVAVVDEDIQFVVLSSIAILRPNPAILSSRYLALALQSPSVLESALGMKSGTAIRRVVLRSLKTLEIPLPSLEQQHIAVERIGAALKKIGLTTDALARSEATLVNLRRCALAESFAASNSTQPLGEVVKVMDNLRVPVSAKVRQSRLGSIPYYGATGQVGTIDAALFDEELLLLGEDGVQFFDPTKPKAYRISGPSWVNNHAHVLKPDPTKVLLGYLLHYLNDFNYRGYANGTTRLKLTKSAMWSIPVPVVSLEQQRETVERIESLLMTAERLWQAVESSKTKLKDLCRAVLRDEFGGVQQ